MHISVLENSGTLCKHMLLEINVLLRMKCSTQFQLVMFGHITVFITILCNQPNIRQTMK
jgi:hypothetical protein